jgi:hypothetical protein
MDVLSRMDGKLSMISDFNQRLNVFDSAVSEIESWLLDARHRIDDIIKPSSSKTFSPEDRVTRAMEMQEDLLRKSEFLKKQETERQEIFPGGEEKVPSDAKRFLMLVLFFEDGRVKYALGSYK